MRQGGRKLDLEGTVPVRQWRIHVGAHKTATTHLQETLTLVRDRLADRGIDFVPTRPLMRKQRFAEVLFQRRPIARLPIFGPAHMRDAIEARVEPMRIGPDVVVLSEENILGRPRHILATPFYPQADQRIGRLASLGFRADLRLFLSIRSYDTLVPSAYAEALKHDPPPPGGFAAMRARLLAAPPSWFDLVARLRAAAPDIPLLIWRQEDYRANDRAIMEAALRPPPRAAALDSRPCPDPLALGGGDRGSRGPAHHTLLRGAAGAGARDSTRLSSPARPASSPSTRQSAGSCGPATTPTSSA